MFNIITLQPPCLRSQSAAECRESYEILLYLLKSMSKRMKTREELLAEIEGIDLPEHTKEVFRRVINTVEDDLTEDQWRDYELDLDKYQRTMSVIRTGREEGREEGIAAEKARIAKAMVESGVPMETIVYCTGLSEKEVQELMT